MSFNGRNLFANPRLSRQYPDIVPSITGPIAFDMASLALNCSKAIGDLREYSPNARVGLCEAVRRFHQSAGLNLDVSEQLSNLTKADAIILRIAHQPNIFPYVGVVGQLVVMHSLATIISESTAQPVCEVFLFVDYDSSRDSRFRTAQLGDIRRKDGRLLINFPVSPKNLNLPMKYLAKPSKEQLAKWLELILDWGRSNLRYLRMDEVNISEARKEFEESLAQLRNFLDLVLARSSSFADFNAFFLSKIVNDFWKYPVLFARLSDVHKTLIERYNVMVSQYVTINKLINEAKSFYISHSSEPKTHIVKGYYAKVVPIQSLPLWYSCESCHSRVALKVVRDEPLEIVGECPRSDCRKSYRFQIGTLGTPDLSSIVDDIFPRIEFQNLCLLPSIGVLAGIGYAGAADHILVTCYVAKKLGLHMPILCLTQPSFIYEGFEQHLIYTHSSGRAQEARKLVSSSRLCSLDIFLNFGIQKSERMLFDAISKSKDLNGPHICHESHISQDESSIVKILQSITGNHPSVQ